jgi:hypothetical protein
MIEINKHPNGRISNLMYGLCSIGDGLVRVLSVGFLRSSFTIDYARYTAKQRINKVTK